jgi:hypothetical protein
MASVPGETEMAEASVVHHVSGDWRPGEPHVRLRIETRGLDEPQDLLLAVGDVQAFVTLLLVLSGKAGTAKERDPDAFGRPAFPLPIDSMGLGETETGDTVLQMNIGETTLAFAMPSSASPKLGQSLLAMSASPDERPAN